MVCYISMDTYPSPTRTAIILAAGKGTRLGRLSAHTAKCMVLLHGVPMLGYAIERLISAGCDRIIVVIEYAAEHVEQYLATLPYTGIVSVRQSSVVGGRYGTAAAVQAGLSRINAGDSALIVSGDSLYSVEALRTCAVFQEAAMMVARVDSVREYGEVVLSADHHVTDLVEKPDDDHAGYINLGAYHVTPELSEYVNVVALSHRNEYEFTDALKAYMPVHPLCAQLIDSTEWTTVTTVDDISQAEHYVNSK